MASTRLVTARADLIPVFAPPWAEIFGEDDFGIFAEFRLNEVAFVWRWIPPGTFLMGSPKGDANAFEDEQPQHEVTISAGFWLGETPVTQAQWQAVTGEDPSHFKGASLPVDSVSWEDAVRFARNLTSAEEDLWVSLPSETQWEYACRARVEGDFYDGSPCTRPDGLDRALDRLGWFSKNCSRTQIVKRKAPNNWGIYDLLGNVWEWCSDSGRHQYAALKDGVPPVASDQSNERSIRGGSWADPPLVCRCSYRRWFRLQTRNRFVGLRLLVAMEPTGAERPAVRPEGRGRTAERGNSAGGWEDGETPGAEQTSAMLPGGAEFVVILNAVEMDELFRHVSGSGGFQGLLRKLQSRCNRNSGATELTRSDMQKISKYAFGYRNGGWQGRLLRIFSRTLGPRLTGQP